MSILKNSLSAVFLLALLTCGLLIATSCKAEKSGGARLLAKMERAPDIRERLAKYAPTEIIYDKSRLDEENRQVLAKLIDAARQIDNIFWKQAYADGLGLKEALEKSTEPWAADYLRFLKINFGPFDRQDGNRPFLGSAAKPAGAGFYPVDLGKKEFEDYLAAHPEAKDQLLSPYTVIKRKDGQLLAVPYNVEYRADLEPIAQSLREAAAITSNESLKAYLAQRAADLLANDYYQSDCLWIDLKDTLAETVIGPFELYEDSLMGVKASYESFVYINDREEMDKIRGYLGFLEEMQQNLPVEPKYKSQKVAGLQSPLNVVNEVFTAGDTKAGIQTSAFVLPNDEKVREEKGTKKVFLKNMMEAKFRKSLVPISQRVLSPDDARLVSFSAYFNEVILHEICHALGTNYVTLADGSKISVNQALKEHNSAIEEAKADIVGLFCVPLLMERGFLDKEKEAEVYTTYLAGIFRALRFGATEAHGLGTLVQYNFLREKGAFLYDRQTGTFKVNLDRVKPAVRDLAAQFLTIEGKGSYEEAGALLARYGKVDDLTQKIIARLADIPVDIEPLFQAK